jgi:hypothetical protein
MKKAEYEECKALLDAWFKDEEYAEQEHFGRALWAVKKLAKSLGYKLVTMTKEEYEENHES